MFLPKKILLVIFSLLILVQYFSVDATPAFANPKPIEPAKENVQQNQKESSTPKQDSVNLNGGEVELIPLPNGNYQITPGDPTSSSAQVTQAINCGPFSFACNAVSSVFDLVAECKANPICYIGAGFDLAPRWASKQVTGCSDPDTNPEGCSEKLVAMYNSVQNGGSIYDGEESPGMLFIAADITDKASQYPVPIDSGQYFASINPLQTAQASGVDELANSGGILKLWTRVRDASYAFMVVIMIIIGFMIMFRTRLDPRTTVSITNSLPRVVVVLLLITFSFALAGLMIDLARLATQLIYLIIPGSTQNFITQLILVLVLSWVVHFFGPVGSFISIALIILVVILALGILLVLGIVLWKMIMRYTMFIILTIFAPAFLLPAALPGREGMALEWVKRQLANIIALPAMLLMIRLAFYIGTGTVASVLPDIAGLTGGGEAVTFPIPFLDPAGSSGNVGPLGLWALIGPLIAFGILFTATKMPEIVDQALGIKEVAPRAGIGPGALIAGPAGAFMAAGNVSRGVGGLRQAGQAYAGTPGVRGALARQATRFFGTTEDKLRAGIIQPDSPQGLRHAEKVREETQREREFERVHATPVRKPTVRGAPEDEEGTGAIKPKVG
jgi:hypothetical protein